MKYFFGLILLTLTFTVAAQEKSPQDYKIAASINPFALAQIDFTFLPGIEYKLQRNLSVVGELGYIFASAVEPGTNGNTRASGFMIRPGIRFYVNAKNNFYLQPQFFFKQVSHQMYDWVGKDCVNGVPAYEELDHFRLRRQVYGVNITAGKVYTIFKGSTLLDLYFGLGFRYRHRKFIGEERGCFPEERANRVMILPEDGLLPSLPLGVRLYFPIR